MRILIVIPTLNSGGAERVTSILCNILIKSNHDVYLVTDDVNYDIFYTIDKRVNVISLPYSVDNNGFYKKLYAIKYIWKLRKILRKYKPDVFISVLYVTYVRSLLAQILLPLKFIISDHTSFDRYQSKYVNFIRYYLYSFADCVTILSKKDQMLVSPYLKNVKVVYNPTSFQPIKIMQPRQKVVLCAGRLDVWDVKGFDIIINIWSRIYQKYPDWKLYIAGSGSDQSRSFLMQMVKNFGLQDNVLFLGQVSDMQSLLSRVSIFALPSRIEGFPMVLLEAMSQGCACISFELKGVVNEIFLSSRSGVTIKDNDFSSFEKELCTLIENHSRRLELSLFALDDIKHFSVNCFEKQWNTLLKKIK